MEWGCESHNPWWEPAAYIAADFAMTLVSICSHWFVIDMCTADWLYKIRKKERGRGGSRANTCMGGELGGGGGGAPIHSLWFTMVLASITIDSIYLQVWSSAIVRPTFILYILSICSRVRKSSVEIVGIEPWLHSQSAYLAHMGLMLESGNNPHPRSYFDLHLTMYLAH